MDKIVLDGQKFAATADLNMSDMSAQAPVGTTLAVLERIFKVMSAVQARIHYAMKQEFKLLKVIIRDNTPTEYSYEPESGDRKAKQSDYDQVNVIPVSDPNASTMAQKVVQYQTVMQMSQNAPQLYDMAYLHRQMLEVIGIKNFEKIVPSPDDMKPTDPVSENMAIMNGKPVKAFMYQDHEAHLGVHMAAIKDPKLAAVMGQNPQAQTIMAAAQAHIMEHVAFQYRREIEKQLGAALPPMPDKDADEGEDRTLPPEIEVQLSQLAAMAAAKLLQQNMSEAQAQQNQQAAQDPLMQLQMQELQIKKAEVDRKAKKDAADAAGKADELKLRETEINNRMQLDGARIGVDIKKHQVDAQRQQELEGVRMGIDIAKHKSQQAQQPKKTGDQ
jgi:hypothetical protein